MPARKDKTLSKRHDTKADVAARTTAESAMKPSSPLTLKPPPILRGRKTATATWNRVRTLYAQTEGEIITAFDENLLVEYCILQEEILVLEKMRDEIYDDWETNRKAAKRTKPTPDTLREWVRMWDVVNALRESYKGFDARLDQKRKHALSLEQSLYLTPRSRAGAAPQMKEPEEPESEMDKLLG